MEIWLAILSGSCAAAIVSGVFGLINRRLDRKEKCSGDIALLKEGQVIELYDRIKYLGRSYISDRVIDGEDLEDLIKMHNTYHKLGGNGYLDSIMDKVRALPLNEEKNNK